ncbi:MAG: hypothetical protein KGJ06_05815 [Pseudomonadota bacterium]|nr:hypothetical protein [Pseudomonadota bacterium]
MDIDAIPSVKDALEALPAPNACDFKWLTELSDEYGGIFALNYALAKKDFVEADAVMAKNHWTPTSIPHPDVTNWHKHCSLIYYACWGNNREIYRGETLSLYHYFTQRDPDCVFGPAPGGGNMLHAWMYNADSLVILKDLSERGVDPLATDCYGYTPMQWLEKHIEHNESSREPEIRREFLAAAKALLEKSISKNIANASWQKRMSSHSTGVHRPFGN